MPLTNNVPVNHPAIQKALELNTRVGKAIAVFSSKVNENIETASLFDPTGGSPTMREAKEEVLHFHERQQIYIGKIQAFNRDALSKLLDHQNGNTSLSNKELNHILIRSYRYCGQLENLCIMGADSDVQKTINFAYQCSTTGGQGAPQA